MDDVARSVFIKKSLNVLRVTSYDNRNHNLKRKMMKLTFSLAALFGVLNTLFADVVLYSSHRCPYCRNVDNYLQSVHKKVSTKIIDDNEVLREELKNKGGKIQVPCLIVDNYPLYGSVEIIGWMKTHPERLQDET
jgi:glutaredoxin